MIMAFERDAEDEYSVFEALVKPLIKYLNENHHPHVTIVITPTGAELLEGCMAVNTNEFLRD